MEGEIILEQRFDTSKLYIFTSLSVICAIVVVAKINEEVRSVLVFAWACFVKPLLDKFGLRSSSQQQVLEKFYKNQAHVYDKTREVLLQGRIEALKLAAAHLNKKKDIVWVDVGGGTGYNIECMDRIKSISKSFKAVYLVDLSPSLCEVARKRFAAKKWNNVHVILADACSFEIKDAKADLITFLYSLSMIPTYHSTIDHASSTLDSQGVVACVDFGVQSADTIIGRLNTLGGYVNLCTPWLLRNFWRIWFEADKVHLEPSRRQYLEYRFGTIKSLNMYNNKLGRIPYYIWIGCDKRKSDELIHRINSLATESPYLSPADDETKFKIPLSKGHEAALSNIQKRLPYPSIYYQREVWRVYYDEIQPQYHQFADQYIYAFTWEDPREDNNILRFTSKDTVLAITSAGDNILSYATLPDAPKRIHAVDLNPCQNHLLELKLAAFRSLTYPQMWSMFGEGRIDNFKDLLITKLSPHMSSQAFQYWMAKGEKTFNPNGNGLYDTGSTRWALRLAKYIFKFFGVTNAVKELCECETMQEQKNLWEKHIKPALFNRFVSAVFIGNPIFLWKALGVPANQAALMGTSVLKYVIDTLEPIIYRSLISKDNYFYYLTLTGRYSYDNCPDYLTQKGYGAMTSKSKATKELPLDRIRLHTDTLMDVFNRLSSKALTIAIIMDHMDWFDPKGQDALAEIQALKKCLAPGGRVLLRSASTHPWYIGTFESEGFLCQAAAVREENKSIDRINMYASTWVCTKLDEPRRRMSSLKI